MSFSEFRKALGQHLLRLPAQRLDLLGSGNMLAPDSLPLPLLNHQHPVFLCKEEIQTGLVRDEVGYSYGNAPAGTHTKSHPAGARVFPDGDGSGLRIVIDFLHRCGRRRLG